MTRTVFLAALLACSLARPSRSMAALAANLAAVLWVRAITAWAAAQCMAATLAASAVAACIPATPWAAAGMATATWATMGAAWAAAGATTIGIWAAMAGGTIAIRRDGFMRRRWRVRTACELPRTNLVRGSNCSLAAAFRPLRKSRICRKFRVRAITMEKRESSYGETEATGYFRRAA